MLNIFKRKSVIEFYCHPNLHGVVPEPKPAAKYIPDWFKRIPQYIPEKKDMFNNPVMTAKKCMPLIDAMSYGYVIPLAGDTRIISNKDCSIISVTNPPEFKTVEFHTNDQIGGKTAPGFPSNPVKFLNPWVIKTAPGWSTLILPLTNDFESPFTCLSGLVDTDNYPKEINFPAIWTKGDYNESLPAGTPLVVAIPIKRNAFPKYPVVRKMTDEEFAEIGRINKVQNSRSHYYTNELREPK